MRLGKGPQTRTAKLHALETLRVRLLNGNFVFAWWAGIIATISL